MDVVVENLLIKLPAGDPLKAALITAKQDELFSYVLVRQGVNDKINFVVKNFQLND